MKRIPNKNEEALLSIVHCESQELKKHSPTVYEWRDIYLEILDEIQFKHNRVAGSHYVTHYYKGYKFYVREMGDKATKVIKIKKGK